LYVYIGHWVRYIQENNALKLYSQIILPQNNIFQKILIIKTRTKICKTGSWVSESVNVTFVPRYVTVIFIAVLIKKFTVQNIRSLSRFQNSTFTVNYFWNPEMAIKNIKKLKFNKIMYFDIQPLETQKL